MGGLGDFFVVVFIKRSKKAGNISVLMSGRGVSQCHLGAPLLGLPVPKSH